MRSLLLLLAIPLSAQIRISAGSPADTMFTGGTAYINTQPLGSGVYAFERYGNFSYQIPVADGAYTVTLHMMEMSPAITAPGQRTFNVSINDSVKIAALDLFAAVGFGKPDDQSFQVTATGGAGISIVFTTVARNAVVSGIDVAPVIAPLFPGCVSDGNNGIRCAGAFTAGAGGQFAPVLTWGGVNYLLPAGDGTGKSIHDNGPTPCSGVDPAQVALNPVCHQLAWQ